MALVKVTPVEGRRVRNEKTGLPLDADVANEVENSIYYHRLAKRGDVVIEMTPETPQPASQSAKRSTARSEEAS